MTKRLKFIGAALLALAILPAAVLSFHIRFTPADLITLGMALGGTVTFTYKSFQHTGAYGGNFTGGSAVAPTAAQAAQISAMTALVNFTDTDTIFVFTHNWNLSTAQIAALFPEIMWQVDVSSPAGTPTAAPLLIVDRSNANLVTFTKATTAGSGGTLAITIRRPHSIGL